MWTSLKPEKMGLDLLFLVFILLLLVGDARTGLPPGSPFVFSFSRFTRCGAEDDYYYSNHYIIVTCIHSIFVVRQQEQIPPTCYNKGPDSTDTQ